MLKRVAYKGTRVDIDSLIIAERSGFVFKGETLRLKAYV